MLIGIGIMVISVFIFWFELKKVKKTESKKESITFVMGFLIAVFFSVTLALGYPIPNPSLLMDYLFQPVAEPLSKVLQQYKER
ncbi:hypothetical protein [Radiobacillus sp. PE A8.2]|uniref:hypothetical protein n=1 Tax=Radiobacillus sp. PE A8.2 TaxID=3380349 RepID=UPI00388EA348